MARRNLLLLHNCVSQQPRDITTISVQSWEREKKKRSSERYVEKKYPNKTTNVYHHYYVYYDNCCCYYYTSERKYVRFDRAIISFLKKGEMKTFVTKMPQVVLCVILYPRIKRDAHTHTANTPNHTYQINKYQNEPRGEEIPEHWTSYFRARLCVWFRFDRTSVDSRDEIEREIVMDSPWRNSSLRRHFDFCSRRLCPPLRVSIGHGSLHLEGYSWPSSVSDGKFSNLRDNCHQFYNLYGHQSVASRSDQQPFGHLLLSP